MKLLSGNLKKDLPVLKKFISRNPKKKVGDFFKHLDTMKFNIHQAVQRVNA